jgi:ketosteroid isomerase-like protein
MNFHQHTQELMPIYSRVVRTRLSSISIAILAAVAIAGCQSTSPICCPTAFSSDSAVCCPPTAGDIAGVRAANNAFYAALNEMFVGNITPMEAVWSHESDVSQLGPMGGRIVGWDAVGKEWRREAALKLGGKVVAENMQVVAGPCMGYTVTEEVGENMTADGKPVEVRFRATNIFRKEQGGWKMVHHHTDLSAGLIGATGEVK